MRRVIAIIGTPKLIQAIAALLFGFTAIIAAKNAVCRSQERCKAI